MIYLLYFYEHHTCITFTIDTSHFIQTELEGQRFNSMVIKRSLKRRFQLYSTRVFINGTVIAVLIVVGVGIYHATEISATVRVSIDNEDGSGLDQKEKG